MRTGTIAEHARLHPLPANVATGYNQRRRADMHSGLIPPSSHANASAALSFGGNEKNFLHEQNLWPTMQRKLNSHRCVFRRSGLWLRFAVSGTHHHGGVSVLFTGKANWLCSDGKQIVIARSPSPSPDGMSPNHDSESVRDGPRVREPRRTGRSDDDDRSSVSGSAACDKSESRGNAHGEMTQMRT